MTIDRSKTTADPPGEAMREAFRKAAASRLGQSDDRPGRNQSLASGPGQIVGSGRVADGPSSPAGRIGPVAPHRVRPVGDPLLQQPAPRSRAASGVPGLAEHAPRFDHLPGAISTVPDPAASMKGVNVPSSWPTPGIVPLRTVPRAGDPEAPGVRREDREEELRRRLESALAGLHRQAADNAAHVRFDAEDGRDLAHRLAAGHVESVARQQSTRTVDIVLGVDFGTSSTKIVARLPYEAGAPAFAVSAPSSARAEEHAHLWASRIWLDVGGLFSLAPLPGATAHCAIKAALMQADDDRVIALRSGARDATALEVATAFLALQLCQARGWLLSRKEDALSAGPLRWAYNVGFPAASLDKDGLRERYAAACAAALSLSLLGLPISLSSVQAALRVVPTTAAALNKLGINLVPEISAAVTGFAYSPKREDGLYAMVDIGAGTMDCCTFNLLEHRHEGEMICGIFEADVAVLGIEPWRACGGDPELSGFLENKIGRQQRDVIWETRQNRSRRSERWRTGLPVFLVGGGAGSEAHRRITAGLDPWLRRTIAGSNGAKVQLLPVPEGLEVECPTAEAHRLAVAFGLSFPIDDIPQVRLPSSIVDDRLLAPQRLHANFISKDVV